MKKVFPFFPVLLFSVIIGGIGCGIGGVSRNQHRGMIEEIDPFTYGDEFDLQGSGKSGQGEAPVDVQAKEDVSDTSQGSKSAPVQIERVKPAETPKVTEPSGAEPHTEGVIYRVQIGVFEEQKSAETQAEEARAKVNMNVYVEFEPPFYRVRVGDIKTRKEAEQYVKVLQSYGFRGAFWVMKRVNIP